MLNIIALIQAQLSELQKMFCQLSESVNVNQNRVEPYTGVCIITLANPKRFSTLRIIDSQNKPTSSPLKLFSIQTSHPATHPIRKRVLKEKHYVF